MLPCRTLIDGVKQIEIHPTGDDPDLGLVHFVEIEHLLPVKGSGGDDAVGEIHDLLLDLSAVRRLALSGPASHLVFHTSQRVEHLHDGQAPFALQLSRHPPREPVVAVDQIIG